MAALPRVSADVKFDAVSGDYYPIVYFNDYWNLQKDYYPINEPGQPAASRLLLRCRSGAGSYAAQSAKSPWNFLGDELYEQSDEEQDSVKVRQGWGLPGLGGEGKWTALLAWGPLAGALLPTSFTTSRGPSPVGGRKQALKPPALAGAGVLPLRRPWPSLPWLSVGRAGPLGLDLSLLPHGLPPGLWAPTRGLCSLALCP